MLARAIVREMKSNPEFQKNFSVARDEIAAAMLAEKPKKEPLAAAIN
jgi:hypothetical protein